MSVELETTTITVTESAANKVREILAQRNMPNHGLRVFVSGGGCSGMQYGMAIEAQPREFDAVIEAGDGVKVFIDPTSMMYLSGANIDYVDNIMGGGFRIQSQCRFHLRLRSLLPNHQLRRRSALQRRRLRSLRLRMPRRY